MGGRWVRLPHDLGHHLPVQQIGDSNGLVAVGTAPAETDATHEGSAFVTPLVPDGAGAAGLALVDREWPSGLARRNCDRGERDPVAPSPGRVPAGLAAVVLVGAPGGRTPGTPGRWPP